MTPKQGSLISLLFSSVLAGGKILAGFWSGPWVTTTTKSLGSQHRLLSYLTAQRLS